MPPSDKINPKEANEATNDASVLFLEENLADAQRERYYFLNRTVSLTTRESQIIAADVIYQDGSSIELDLNEEHHQLEGTHHDSTGKVVETAIARPSLNQLFFTDLTTGSQRTQVYDNQEAKLSALKTEGEYNSDLVQIIRHNANGELVRESLDPGRTEVLKKDGSREGSTILGEHSKIDEQSTTVTRPDGSELSLTKDSLYIKPDASSPARSDSLSPVESKFLKEHSNLDPRDLLEIHFRYPSVAQKEAFYSQLERINQAALPATEQKNNLLKNIMHHVAHPEEINQGASVTCGIGTTQRYIAMWRPELYGKLIADALTEGKIHTAQGKMIPVAPDKLTRFDTSNRDLATRIFHGLALQATYHPHYQYKDILNGYIRLEDKHGNIKSSPGMTMAEQAEMIYKLSGAQMGLALINTPEALKAAMKDNNDRPLISLVNLNAPPVSTEAYESVNYHMITATEIEGDTIYFQNQYGLEMDHSTKGHGVPLNALLENMLMKHSIADDGPEIIIGEVLIPGDRKKAYKYVNGKFQIDSASTIEHLKNRALLPDN